jgi:hypothetical protein
VTPPQQVAEPADEPQAALIATCTCGRRIWRLALDSARWRHDNWGITCPPPDPAFDHLVKGDSA